MKIEFPEGPAGIHPPTAALTKILKSKQINNPITEKPYSEALLFGIGGGLDIGYILFQFNHLPHPMLILGFRNQWNHTKAFLEELSNRMHLSVQFREFDDRQKAQEALQKTIKKGQPAIVWVDKAHLPYREMPENLQGFFNHQVTVYARDGRLWRLYIDDLSSQLFEIREKIFTEARGHLTQNNYLMMSFRGAQALTAENLREAVIQGIKDCSAQLTRPMKTMGISNLETWSESLLDTHNRQAWPQIFKDQKNLYPVLRTIYESIKLNGTGGFALRKLYSDFLHEAAGLLNNPALNAIAGQYLQLSNHWSILAENALPSKIPVFDRVKNLLTKNYEAHRAHDLETYQKTLKDLQNLETDLSTNFPLDESETHQLFKRLANQLQLIAELETSAAHRLRSETRR